MLMVAIRLEVMVDNQKNADESTSLNYSKFCSIEFIASIHTDYQINYVRGFKSVVMLDVN